MVEKTLTQRDIMQILDIVRSAPDVAELRLRCGDFEIELSRYPRNRQDPAAFGIPFAHTTSPTPAVASTAELPLVAGSSSASAAAPSASPGQQGASGTDWEVHSPMVGTCYEAPEPGAKPFVAVGDRVEADAPLCIVEVMKLMNTVTAGKAGVVKSIHFTDRQPVEYGQLLFVIAPE